MKRKILLMAAGISLGCGSGEPTAPGELPAAAIEATAARLSVMMVAVAAGRQGRSYFDNFLPCVRRGVIDYSNTDNGRRVTFSGCDLGEDIVVDGSGFIDWRDPTRRRETFCVFGAPSFCANGLRWSGDLTITTPAGRGVVQGFEVTDLVMTPGGTRFPDFTRIETGDLGFESLTAVLNGRTVSVTGTRLPVDIFDSAAVRIAPIPNPGGRLAALTEPDVKRIAYQAAVELASIQLNETLEAQRPDHTHTLECGTIAVTVNRTTLLPTLTNNWTGCDLGGLTLSGQFTVEWGALNQQSVTMVVEGSLALEGGVPRIATSGFVWTVTLDPNFPAGVSPSTISGQLIAGSERRDYSFELILDD